MANTRLVGRLRIAMGLGMVAIGLTAGVMQRSPWILPFLTMGFTAAYEFGQLRTWRHSRASGRTRQYWLQLPADTVVQFLLASVLYLIGFGFSALISGTAAAAAFGPGDAIWPLAAGAVAVLFGLYIDRAEGKPASYFPLWASEMQIGADEMTPDQSIRLSEAPVTPESFFAASLVEAGSRPAAAGLPAGSGLSDDDITRLEARLGRALPDLLIDLYHQRDGGPVNAVCVPRTAGAPVHDFEDILIPFGIDNELNPSAALETAWDALAAPQNVDWQVGADVRRPEDRARIVLAQWNLELLFLDYTQPGPPRVGFVDFGRFDIDGKPEPILWWPDFDAFFASLRHYEPA